MALLEQSLLRDRVASSSRVVAVANQHSGVGKTTVVTLLNDALPQNRFFALHGLRPSPTRPDEENTTETGRGRIVVTGQRRRQPFVDDGKADCELIVLDTPGGADGRPMVERALDGSDFVVVPLTPDAAAIEETLQTLADLIEPRRLRYAVLLNRMDVGHPSQLGSWQRLLDTTWGVPRFDAYLPTLPLSAHPAHAGRPVTAARIHGRHGRLTSAGARIGEELSLQFLGQLSRRW